jgi:hypothetical protein
MRAAMASVGPNLALSRSLIDRPNVRSVVYGEASSPDERSEIRETPPLDAPDVIPTHKSGEARIATELCASIISHRKRRIASIIVTAHAAPKIATNARSPCAAARPQPSAASAESMISSRTHGSIYRILFISHLFWKRPDPPRDGMGRDWPVGMNCGRKMDSDGKPSLPTS